MSDNRVPVLAITGGDVAGKSELLEQVQTHYGERIVFVPEAASATYGDSANPFPDPDPTLVSEGKRDWLANFQKLLACAQVVLEAIAQQQAIASGAKLIITDRGILDHWAFLTPEQMPRFCKETGLSVENARLRYNAVLYLESLALSKPELFTGLQLSNPDRRPRSIEEASELEKATRAAWSQHDKVTVIEGDRPESKHFKVAKEVIDNLLAN